ncbi:ABC transporter ATP-binding protein [Arthrobacter sp. 7Tela_A1]|uniref:ABC transporter ATP-binding protein n=1 Tax=Arthrobacter sp. 7Tela_A1 TaxID=3093745 RepID=UPI003BB67C90
MTTAQATDPVLQIMSLEQHFKGAKGSKVVAVDDVSLSVHSGQTVGVVGESGSGKTTLGRTALRLYDPTAGRIYFEGEDVTRLRGSRLTRHLRRRSSMIFQNASTALNPSRRLGESLAEPLEVHRVGTSRTRAAKVEEALESVGIDPAWSLRYPRQLSGGQRQRVGVLRALMLEPSLIVADEPTAALDVSVQAQVVNLLRDIQLERGISYLFISHDLELVRYISHNVLVLYLGRVVEYGTAEQVFGDPRHPYTVSLVSMGRAPEHRLVPQGDIPSPSQVPSGCAFSTRCPLATDLCRISRPVLTNDGAGRMVACHRAGELAVPGTERAVPVIPHPLAHIQGHSGDSHAVRRETVPATTGGK